MGWSYNRYTSVASILKGSSYREELNCSKLFEIKCATPTVGRFWGRGFHTVRSGIDPGDLRFRSRFDKVVEISK